MAYKVFYPSFKLKILLIIIAISIFSAIVFSHEEELVEATEGLAEILKSNSVEFITIAAFLVSILVLVSLTIKNKSEETNWLLFLGIAIPIILATGYSAYSTIYLNVISETKGPVHWHADYEVWSCGEKIDLVKATGLSNKVGNPIFHSHGDNRIHVEGVVVDTNGVDLHNFFETVGGYLENDRIEMPTNGRTLVMKNGDLCNGKEGKLQVFLYKIKNPEDTKKWIFEQQKLENFEDYVLSPYSQIPQGDCIIIEFGEDKQTTDHICVTYRNAIERGELSGG